ncbi:hypothetical protein M407DRAFT_35149 [Tulasnella calospora MUT 4182]|uniref:Uncharacterized protein n=1 Tax=Tulasnella calospora MUT 4182 TaxID=1051891 RepID=A0A0C3Q0A6_9AGAM|nr:hypothetical protein M407DRAFT_35149 [Tulasnella calospora MUT 4182]
MLATSATARTGSPPAGTTLITTIRPLLSVTATTTAPTTTVTSTSRTTTTSSNTVFHPFAPGRANSTSMSLSQLVDYYDNIQIGGIDSSLGAKKLIEGVFVNVVVRLTAF